MGAFRKLGDGQVPKEEARGSVKQREGRFPGFQKPWVNGKAKVCFVPQKVNGLWKTVG